MNHDHAHPGQPAQQPPSSVFEQLSWRQRDLAGVHLVGVQLVGVQLVARNAGLAR